MFGENLTLEGVDVSGAVIGERWRIGTVELQVCQPRLPCFKLGLRFGDPQMVKLFAQAGRPGAYLRILQEGELGAGDVVDISDRPTHGVTIAQVSQSDHARRERARKRRCGARAARVAVALDARARGLIRQPVAWLIRRIAHSAAGAPRGLPTVATRRPTGRRPVQVAGSVDATQAQTRSPGT